MQQQRGVSALTSKLFGDQEALAQRLEALDRYEAQGQAGLPNPLDSCQAWPEVSQAILNAANNKLPTLVYGDYDVDGSLSSFMLFRWLRANGVPGNCFLPSRFKHGYGLDAGVIKQAASQGYKLLIALDCGTANNSVIKQALNLGLEVVVIDHHLAKDEVPAVPLLNPHFEDSLGPYCTAGLMFEVLRALNAMCPDLAVVYGDEIELAGLATIADVVPLTGQNWLLAHLSLLRLPHTVNLGLAELLKVAGLHSLTRLTARQAAFNIIPRLNAAGRMKSARLVLDLLGAENSSLAGSAAAVLEGLNRERREITDRNFRQAALQALEFEQADALALYGPDWHLGVLGIIAARVAESVGKPTIILADHPTDTGLLTGSARAAGGENLVEGLERCKRGLASFGGHKAAAGLKVNKQELEAFREDWSRAIKQIPKRENSGAPDFPRVKLYEFTEEFEKEIWRLAPFGEGFPAATCILEGCRVHHFNYMGRDKLHISVTLTDGERQVVAKGFYMSHLAPGLNPGEEIEPVVRLDVDNYNNSYTIQLGLVGLNDDQGNYE